MRTFRHWTPRYIWNRIWLQMHFVIHPDEPWLTKKAVELLSSWIDAKDVGFEWGCGRSTVWFGKRVHHLTSIEHDAAWYEHVRGILDREGIHNVDLHLRSLEGDEESEYVGAMTSSGFEFVLVDGRMRTKCIERALSAIKPGGLLVLDNSERYFVRGRDSRIAVRNDLREKDACTMAILLSWRAVWTTNGIWDTIIFVKPSDALEVK